MQSTLAYQPTWNTATLVAFRFIFVYFVIYIVPFPFYWVPYTQYILEPVAKLFFSATEQLGKLAFNTAYVLPPETTGSGDTMHNYVQVLLTASISAGISVIWSVLDSKRRNYDTVLYWFTILLRYYLAVVMLSYGVSKVFRTQFPPLTVPQLNKSFGDASPMNLLWTFMGYSGAYSVFTGLGEVAGGILLLFKRTRLLGALLVSIVMSHVVMLNFAYDVPVKLFSTHLLLIALTIMAPDLKRLLNFFILNKPVEPELTKPIYNTPKRKWVYFSIKSLLLIYLLGSTTINGWKQRDMVRNYFASVEYDNSIDGQYHIETFVLDNDTLPAIQNDTRRWKEMMINGKDINLQSMDGASMRWHFLGNVGYRRMVIYSPDLSTYGNFTFLHDSSHLTINGVLNDKALHIVANKKSGNEFLLMSRGFHWINEYPFNR